VGIKKALFHVFFAKAITVHLVRTLSLPSTGIRIVELIPCSSTIRNTEIHIIILLKMSNQMCNCPATIRDVKVNIQITGLFGIQ
jgi:hypothetical protein